MRLNSQEYAFAVEAYFSNGCSVITTQHRQHFNIAPLVNVPDQKSILLWVAAFRSTGNVMEKKKEVPRPVRSPEKIEVVRPSILKSPRRSALKYASALRIYDRSVRRIIHDLHYHPYKLVVVQELSGDFNSRNACEVLLENVPEDVLL